MFIDRLIKKQAIYSVFTLLVLTLIIFGSSYALFQASFADTNTQTMNIGELSVTFSNTSDAELSNNDAINLTGMVPMSDADATDANKTDNLYAFIVRNNGTIAYSYTVKLTDNENYISGGTNNPNGDITLLDHDYIRYKLNNEDNKTLGGQVNDIIYTYTINPGESHEFILRLWVADPEVYNLPNEVLDTEVHLNIIIEGEASNIRAPKGWLNVREGTLLAGIKGNYSEPTVTLTTPGQEVSTTNEKIMAETRDDYGTSYYFRGTVENNYVVFAGMCWRIVRIDGQGNIKLTLYNYNPTGNASPCAASLDAPTMAFARVNDSYTSEFNTNYNHNAYIGYMYGDVNGSTYDEVHANTNKSTILTFLMTWYDEKLRSYNDILADTIWCNDKRVVKDTTYDPWNLENVLGTGLGTDKTYYMATKRLYPSTSASRSLKCGETTEDSKISKFTASDKTNGNGALTFDNKEYKIGLLTADEIAFAGATAGTGNSSYYLYKNANDGSNYYWSLSPSDMDGNVAYVWYVGEDGNLDRSFVDSSNGVRPAVSLKSTASITSGGNGTQDNPFVISES